MATTAGDGGSTATKERGAPVAGRSISFRGRTYPVVLPTVRDPRLHLAAVIITIHFLGVTALGFQVTVPQILSAIVTCAVIEVVITLRRTGALVWPASAMLTGSGVALIFRVLGTERGDIWSWYGWYLFAAVAAFSLATKYLVHHRGSHVFNPSNVGLVVAFLVLGSERVAPLDFWWAPLDFWMATAYAVILVGGVLITRRLRLIAMAATFWLTLAAGLGVLAASGHCMTTAWSLQPVCGTHFWWVVIASPEVLIFLFFMITDPKTIPLGNSGRVAFAVAIAVTSTLLIAPQTTEFGAKVGLLAGLALMSPLRYAFDRALGTAPGGVLAGLTSRRGSPAAFAPVFARGLAIGAVGGALLVAIVAAGAPARDFEEAAPAAGGPQVEVTVDPATLPEVIVSEDAAALNDSAAEDPQQIALDLATALEVEAEAVRRVDPSLLRTVDTGIRLNEMEAVIVDAIADGERTLDAHSFTTLHLDVAFTDGAQGGASLAMHGTGDVERVTYDQSGAEIRRSTEPFDSIFVLDQSAEGTWMLRSVDDG